MGILDFFKQKEEVSEPEIYPSSLQPYIDGLVVTIQACLEDDKISQKKEQSVIMSKHHALRRAIKEIGNGK